jgi:hypothetical protein
VFGSWVDIAAGRLVQSGLAPGRARELAISMLAALEGAFVLARALRSTEPLEVAGVAASASVRDALAEQQRRASAAAGGRIHPARKPRG